MTDNLTQLRICVEKPIPEELNMIKYLGDKYHSNLQLEKSLSSIMNQKFWPFNVKKITISFGK